MEDQLAEILHMPVLNDAGDMYATTDWDAYIGQTRTKRGLKLMITAAHGRGELLRHSLITGPAGTGKSTIARLIAQEHDTDFLSEMCTPDFNMNAFINRLLHMDDSSNGGGGGVVFLDEIHQLTKNKQHYLYSILHDGEISLDDGEKYKFRHKFCFLGATTDEHLLTKPLRDRFKNKIILDPYNDNEMAQIIQTMCEKAGVDSTEEDCQALALASAGSPRQAGSLVSIARDIGMVDMEIILDIARISPEGLTADHMQYLFALRDLGHTAGIESIANMTAKAPKILKELERLLIIRDYIRQTKGGRSITKKGFIWVRDNGDILL